MAETDDQPKSETKPEPKNETKPEPKHDHPAALKPGPAQHGLNYYAELNRVVALLFVGILALMTFLLTVGVQRPHAQFSWALYSAVVVLALNLVAFVAGHMFFAELMGKVSSEAPDAQIKAARSRLKVMRIIQQALFIIAVACVVWFAISAAQFFFNLPASPAGGAAPTQG